MSTITRVAEMPVSQQRLYRAGLMALVMLALLLRFHGMSVPVIWYDEAFSVLLSERSPALIWAATARDVHPPLYYVILHYWVLLFGHSVISLRGLSAVADVGALMLCLKLMSLVATRRATIFAGLMLVLLPLSLRYSQEVRMYTLLGFWLMAATVALVCWSRQPQARLYAIAYVLLMAAAFYTHYFAALCVLVHWLYWSGFGDGEPAALPIRKWLMANVAIVALYLPWLPNLIDQLRRMDGLEWVAPTTWEMLPGLVSRCIMMVSATGGGLWWALLVTALMLACCVLALRYGRADRRSTFLLMAYFFVPAIAVFLVSLIIPVFVTRYLVFAALGLPLLAALALDGLAKQRPLMAYLCLSLFLAAEVHGALKVYAQEDGLNGTDVRKLAWLDSVAEGINRQAQAGDEIVVDGLFWYLPFTYYNATGIQPRLYISRSPDGTPQGPYDYGGWRLIPQRLDWIFFSNVSTLKPVAKRIWWVTGKPRPEDVVTFPKDWKQTLTVKGNEAEARLFILDGGR
ncbi:hypothetical protein ASD60_09670 [Pseudomonas sp. Root562]|nr:hypothetical protein ASD60_09670 [Pseudomonas sp. Root562]